MVEKLDERASKKNSNPPPVIKKKEISRTSKIKRQKRGPVIICRVDTNNSFMLNGKIMYIDSSVKEYSYEQTPEGKYYAMDEIYVFTEKDGETRYFNQSIDLIDKNMIREALS